MVSSSQSKVKRREMFSHGSLKQMVIVTFIFLFISTSFIILIRTIDIINIRNFLYFSSFSALSLNPYSYFPQPTPPVFLSILLPQFCLYLVNFNLQVASDFFRYINLLFSVLLSLLVWKIAVDITNDKKKGMSAFYVLLLSPFFFYVNFVFNEQDIFPIFLTVLSFYLIQFGKNDLVRFTGSFLLIYAAFFYYFPILLVPTLIIYSPGKRRKLLLFTFLIFSFLLFYSSFLITLNWDILGNGIGALGASAGDVPVFSIFNIFPGVFFHNFTPLLTAVNGVLIYAAVALALILPLLFRYLNLSIFVPIAFILAFPFLFLKIYNWDEFLWPVPFFTLAIVAISSDTTFLKTKLLLSQIYLLPTLVVLNMFGAPGYGQGTGIFYFTYGQFKLPIVIYSIIPSYERVSRVLDLIGFLLLLGVIVYVIIIGFRRRDDSLIDLKLGDIVKNVKSNLVNLKSSLAKLKGGHIKQFFIGTQISAKSKFISRKKSHVNRRALLVYVLVFLAIWLLLVTPFSIPGEKSFTVSGGPFPLGLFSSSNPEMVKGLSYNYLSNNSFIDLTNYSGNAVPPPIFSRNISNQNIQMKITIIPEISDKKPYSDLVAGFDTLNISILNQYRLTNSSYSGSSTWLNITDHGAHYALPYVASSISIMYNGSYLTISSGKESETIYGIFDNFWFGRTTATSPGVEIAFQYLKISSISNQIILTKEFVLIYIIPVYAIIPALGWSNKRLS